MKNTLLCLLLALPASAFAEITASLTAASEYISAGRTQTASKPAVQGGLNFIHSSGFYYKNWASNVDYGVDDHTLFELDTYFGYSQAVSEHVKVDGGIAPYFFFGGSHARDINYYDLYLTFTLFERTTIATTYAPDYVRANHSNYRITLSHIVPFDDFTLGLEVANTKGFRDKKWNEDASSYQYLGVSISTQWQGLTWQALATATNIKDSPDKYFNADPAAVLRITKAWSF